jgi:hypothetical protein
MYLENIVVNMLYAIFNGMGYNVGDLVVIIMNDMECVNLLPTLGD